MRTLVFALGDASVTVGADDPAMADAVAGLFRPLVRGDAGRAGVPDLTVERSGGAYRVEAPGPDGASVERRFRSLPDLLADVEFTLLRRLLAGARRRTHLHASGAVVDGRAVLALGDSGAGKSSLALAWSRAGVPVLGDDAVLVDGDALVSGVPRLVKVHRPALEALGLVPADTVAAHARSPELWWDPVRGGGWALDPVPVAVVARVRWVAGSTTRMTDLKASEGLRVLLDNVLQGGLKPAESLDRMVAMVESAVSVDLRFGSAADGARALAGRAKGREGP